MSTITWTNFLGRYLRPILFDSAANQIDEASLNALVGLTISDLYTKGVYDIGPLPSQLADNTAYTIINALTDDGYPLLAAGVKYFVYSDPFIKFSSAAGEDVTKDKALVEALHNNYCKLVKAYVNIYYYGIDKQQYWLTLLNCGEDCDKVNENLSALKPKLSLAVNEYNTSQGVFGVSYISDYKVDYTSTVETVVPVAVNSIDFGFAGSITNETITGAEVDVSNYRTFSLTFISPSECTIELQIKQPDGSWLTSSTSIGNVFVKKYLLLDVDTIRLRISTTALNTNFEIRGKLEP